MMTMTSNDSDSKKKCRKRGANTERGFKPYHSVSVPKNADLMHNQPGDRPKTTVMLRNIPNRYSQAGLLKEIDAAGFKGSYDFFYLPMDTKNRTNVGYAFINFLSTEDLERFMADFASYVFPNCSTPKAARVSLAHIQGFIENIRHFSNRAVSQSRNSQYRPIVIHRGIRMDISEAYSMLCSVQETPVPVPAQVVSPAVSTVNPAQPVQPVVIHECPPGLEAFGPPCAMPPMDLSQLSMHGMPAHFDLSMLLPMACDDVPMPKMSAVQPAPAETMLMQTGEDCIGAYCQARRGLEGAISMYLSSYRRPDGEPSQMQDDDEQTDCEASAPNTPRRLGLDIAKFSLPHDDTEAEAATPRTNKTLFVHGRFSA